MSATSPGNTARSPWMSLPYEEGIMRGTIYRFGVLLREIGERNAIGILVVLGLAIVKAASR